ncbi:tRNA(Ile)-2-lysyl-cytidine synthase [Psidium guajava]|nr:tRNA(Ile)-2-lysyl-cytidine synthase [Psidium guajava]
MILQVAEMERLNNEGVGMSYDGDVPVVMRISQDHSLVVGCCWSSLMRGQTISLVPSSGASLEFQLTFMVTVCTKNNEDVAAQERQQRDTELLLLDVVIVNCIPS